MHHSDKMYRFGLIFSFISSDFSLHHLFVMAEGLYCTFAKASCGK